jgi:hypothetical protein
MKMSADDHAAILNLYAEYNVSSDAGDAINYAKCFCADGELIARMMKSGKLQPPFVDVRGFDGLVNYKRSEYDRRGGIYKRHWNGSIFLTQLEPGKVRGQAYLNTYNYAPNLPPVMTSGVYDDLVVRVDDKWRFARRYLIKD